tara:strand:- start:8066 stop:8272 length:207 start_codon:yes stop_codon:yes gene_type:complete
MQLLSFGSFYLGIEKDKYCDFSIHLGNILLEYQCPSAKSKDDKLRPIERGDGLSNAKACPSGGAISDA